MILNSANQGLGITQEEMKKEIKDKTDGNKLSEITKTGGEKEIWNKADKSASNSI
jgi:hypothetical protein